MKIGKFSAVSLLAVVPLIILTADPAHAAAPSYYPSGPQQNVSIGTLEAGGWSLCWSGGYGETDSLDNIYAACTGESILYAAGATNSDTYMLVAAGPRSTIFSETGHNETIEANGTYWYLNPTQSMGFSPVSTISQSSADVSDTSNVLKMSWHTGYCGANMICGGWRVGSVIGLNGDNGYTRAIWHSGAAAVNQPEQEAVIVPAVSQEEYDALQAQYDALLDTHNLLEADYTALVDSHDLLIAEYQDYTAYATAEFSNYETTVADLNSAIESYKATIDGNNTTISSYINKIDSLNEAIAAKEATISDLNAKLKASSETIESLNSIINETTTTLQSTEEKLAKALETLAKSKSDYELEKAKSADLNKQLTAALARIKDLESKLADVTAKLEAMTAKQDATQKELDAALETIDMLTQQLKDANATIAEQKDKLEQIKAMTSEEEVEQNLALAEELTTIAIATFATAEKDSEEYDLALEMLAVAAIADDPDLPEELAALPVVGAVAGEILNVMNDLGNIGADIAPEQRERAEEIVVASVIAGNIAVSASASTPSGGARRKV